MEYPRIDMERTGHNIESLCKEKELSVKALQSFMGFTCPQTIYRWFHGNSLPSLDNFYALSKLLEMSINDILVAQKGNKPDDNGSLFQMRMRMYGSLRLVCI